MFKHLLLTTTPTGIATLTLNRPALHNAFNEVMIAELITALQQLEHDSEVRVVQLAATGENFSAGADLQWMQRMAQASHADNLADAQQLAHLMQTLNQLSKPTIALVQGAAMGGGIGLIACCDLAIATATAKFCFSEVRLGLIPAVISPYVLAALGERAARRYFLTAESFDALEAQRLGLVHLITEPDALLTEANALAAKLLHNGPLALQAAKALIADVAKRPIDTKLNNDTATRIAAIRLSAEGQEGISAFLAKRKPKWVKAE